MTTTAVRALYDLPAPAKLNLFLHVLGRRSDGLHLLQSVFVLIDWMDRLHVERRSDGALHRHDLGVPLPDDDLCLRAAAALQRASGTPLGADIHIVKQVPAGAGMGGGSSDAATVLLALNRLWALDWPRERLAGIGLTLGADVPFFVHGENAFVEGVGERLTPVAVAPAWYAVVKPAGSLATRDIFGDPGLARNTAAILAASFDGGSSHLNTDAHEDAHEAAGLFGRNDLQSVAERWCGEVAQAAGWLRSRYGNSRMTGSGSAVFARAGQVDPLKAAFPANELPPGWVGRMCRGLAMHPLRGWAG